MTYDAIILSGGKAARLGGVSKGDLRIGPHSLLEHALGAAGPARYTCVVGPAPDRDDVIVTREDPPFGGPVAAIAAGLRALPEGADAVLVLACDMPLAANAVPDLVGALPRAEDGVWALDSDGHAQPLLALYRRDALTRAIAAMPTVTNASMRALTGQLRMRTLTVTDAARDADTWNDVESLREEWT